MMPMTDIRNVSAEPDSKRPFFIPLEMMEPCYFVIRYRGGSELHQYEARKDGRFIAHHWPEIDFKAVSGLEAWALVKTEDGQISTHMLKHLDIDPEKVEPIFVYKSTLHLHLKGLLRRVTRFGYRDKKTGVETLWDVKKNHTMYKVEV